MLMALLFVLAQDMVGAFSDITDALTGLQSRSERRAATDLSAPTGQSVTPDAAVQLTLTNPGDVALGQFSDWDVIFEIQQSSGFSVKYLTYTTNASPGVNEWTVKGIYLDSDTLSDEVVDPGVFNPGEEMIVLANPSPTVVPNTYDRATFVTPNGVVAKVIFQVHPYLYVVDEADRLAYKYTASGTYLSSSPLDAANANARGIATDETSFWATDPVDDKTYKYTSAFALVTSWSHALLNLDATGVATNGTNIWISDDGALRVFKYDMNGDPDVGLPSFALNLDNADPSDLAVYGSNIWVVDDVDDRVYKYDTSGNFISSFSLTAANSDPTGITTNGVAIWVVDVADDAVYRYNMSGTYMSSFSLTAANGDPQGLTVSNR
jgi:hypothetical protein